MKFLRAVQLFAIITLSMIQHNGFAAEQKSIDIATLDYCPLICDPAKEPQGRKGMMVDIAEEIFKRSNTKININIMPFTRAIMEVTQGSYDALLGGEVAQAPSLLYPLHPIISNHAQIFALASNPWNYEHISSLKNIRLIATQEFGYANEQIDHFIKENRLQTVILLSGDNISNRALTLLEQEKADAFIDGHLVFHYNKSNREKNKSLNFKTASPVLGVFHNFLSFSPKTANAKKWMKQIDNEIPKLIEEGFVRKIYLRYGIPLE